MFGMESALPAFLSISFAHTTRKGGATRLLPAVVALFFLAACGKEPEPPPEPRLVSVVPVNFAVADGDVAYSGEVRARYETNLGFRVPGKIVTRSVEVGSVVQPRQILARLDPEDQELSAQGARSQLEAAQSDFDQTKADLERYSDLLQKRFISQAEYDRRLNAFNTAKARLDQAKAQLSVNENQAGYTTLIADNAGVVTAILAEVGQVVAAGQTVIQLARTGEKEIVIAVPENRLSEIAGTRDIAITLWADSEKSYRGKVREISPAADPVTRTYAARITVLDADAEMRLGMTANVYLKGLSRAAVVRLPATALFQDNGKPAVWLVDAATGQVSLVPVEIGEFIEDQVTVLSGLKEGDRVVRAGVHKLFAGEKVRILEDLTKKAAQ